MNLNVITPCAKVALLDELCTAMMISEDWRQAGADNPESPMHRLADNRVREAMDKIWEAVQKMREPI